MTSWLFNFIIRSHLSFCLRLSNLSTLIKWSILTSSASIWASVTLQSEKANWLLKNSEINGDCCTERHSLIYNIFVTSLLELKLLLVQSCSVSLNSCKSESVKLSPEATLKVTNGQNSCTGWAKACIRHQEK